MALPKKARIGVIGVAQIGKFHIENYQKIDGAVIVAIADIDQRVTVHGPMSTVIPAKAGIQSGARPASPAYWIPAFAGMTANTGL